MHSTSGGLLQRFVEMSSRRKIESLKWWTKYIILSVKAKVNFGLVSWRPRGKMPVYLAYYPESLRSDRSIPEFFAKWIRGNRINNNGDAARFISLILNVRKVMEEGVEGDIAELGVWRGNSASLLAHVAHQHGRSLFLFDTFEGFDARDIKGIDSRSRESRFEDTSLDYVKETVGFDGTAHYVKGFFPESVPESLYTHRFSIVHIDCDLYAPMKAALEFFYPRMLKGALLIMHDYHSGAWPGATEAINEFCAATGESLILLPDKSGTAMCRKTA